MLLTNFLKVFNIFISEYENSEIKIYKTNDPPKGGFFLFLIYSIMIDKLQLSRKSPEDIIGAADKGQLNSLAVAIFCGPGSPRHMTKHPLIWQHDAGELVEIEDCRKCGSLSICQAKPLFRF